MNDQKKRADQPVKQLPQWKVILHNDEINEAGYVQEKVEEIIHLPNGEAMVKVVEAHKAGQSILLTTHHERAELIEERFKMARITVTLVKA